MISVGINGRTFGASNPGGAVQVGMEITSKFIEKPNFDVTVYGPPSIHRMYEDTSSRFYPFDSQVFGLFWEKVVFPKIDLTCYDLLLCPNGNGPLSPIDIPVVLYIHDINSIKGMAGDLYGYYRKYVIPRAADAADVIVTVSEFSKREIMEHLQIPSGKIQVVHNGLKEIYIHGISGNPVNVPENYILYVGQLNPRKNVESLVEGFHKYAEETSREVKLVHVGPGNKKIFKNIDISNSDIIRMGYLSDLELKYVYSNADAFLFPSLHEGFGLPPLEAMACKTPVITSDAGALPEVLGNFPYYVNPESTSEIASALQYVLDEYPFSNEHLHGAQEYARTFTWDAAATRLEKIFRTL